MLVLVVQVLELLLVVQVQVLVVLLVLLVLLVELSSPSRMEIQGSTGARDDDMREAGAVVEVDP